MGEAEKDEFAGRNPSEHPEKQETIGPQEEMMTFGGHLEVFRTVLIRIVVLTVVCAIVVFCFKDTIFKMILAPHHSDFIFYRSLRWMALKCGLGEGMVMDFKVNLINTELGSQFMTHIMMSCYLGLLVASPYIVYQIFRFISPALYEHERKYSVIVVISVYFLFMVGLLCSYYIIFPVSFRFLGTYQVSEEIVNMISLSSYISSFILLSFMLGLVFELPVLAFMLGKMGWIDAAMLKKYRKHAFVVILIVAALITPPDVFSQLLVGLPICLLYEFSTFILRWTGVKSV